jgi:hypothetical protein
MAKKVLEVEMRGRDRMGDKVSKNASHFQKLGRTILAAGGAYVSFRMASRAASAAVDVMTDSLKHGIAEAIAYEDAQIKIAQAMKAGGVYTQQNYELILSYASALQKTTVFTENEILAAEAMLATFKLQPDVLREALGLTLDMAAATGQDLVQAAVIMGKAAVGVTGTLSRYGIIVDQADLKTRGFAAVVDEMNKNFGGTAQAMVSGYSGQLGLLSKAWDDITRAVAELITRSPAIRAVFETTRVAVEALTEKVPLATEVMELYIDKAILGMYKVGREALVIIQDIRMAIEKSPTLGLLRALGRMVLLLEDIANYGKIYDKESWTNYLIETGRLTQEAADATENYRQKFARQIDEQEKGYKTSKLYWESFFKIETSVREDLPGLIELENGLTYAITQQGQAIPNDVRLLEVLRLKIKDLTTEVRKAKTEAATPIPSFLDVAIRPEHAEGLGTIMRDLATAGLEESAAKWDEYWEARLEVSRELSAQLREDREGYWGTEFEAIEASKEHWLEWGMNIDQINEWVANRQKELVVGVAQEWTAGMSSAMATLAEGAHVSANVARRSAQLQALVDTYASANAAYKAMAGIPVVGPILAITAAAAAVAAGLANVKKIEKQKFGLGGWIGGFGGGDRELFYGSPGEFVVRPGPARANAGPLEDMNRGGVPAYNPRQTTVHTELTINVTGFAAQDILESAQHGPIREAFQEALDRQYITVKELVQ